jgi:hypothetical protein
MPSDRDRPEEDVDAAFAAIIAGWDDVPSLDDPASSAEPSHPDDPGDGEPGAAQREDHAEAAEAAEELPSSPAAPSPSPSPSAATGPRDWSTPEESEDDDRYHPPEPPPLPRGDLAGRLAWAGVLLGPAFLFVAGLFWRTAPRLWLAIAVLAFVGGFVTLVLRLPADRDDSDGDDGAVV